MKRMKIGIIGKPNVGKSTLYNAITMGDSKVGNYPFTTIDSSEGVGYVSLKCRCRELGVQDNPVNSICIDGIRFVPIKIMDTAGLVPDAWRGRGLGNQFLSEIMKAEGLIHVIDLSGETDEEGRIIENPDYDPKEEVEFVREEVVRWIASILQNNFQKVEKQVRHMGVELETALHKVLSGLNISLYNIIDTLDILGLKDVSQLSHEEALLEFSEKLLEISKPIIISGNKIDKPKAEENYRRLKAEGIDVIPVSALSEYILKRLARDGIIHYIPGADDFEVLKPDKIDDKMHRILEMIREKILKRWGGTGVQKMLNTLVYQRLGYIAVYPVRDPNKYTDVKGNVLPDVYLIKKGSTVKDLAELIHTDLASRVKYGIDVLSKKRISLNYELNHRDVISIAIY